MTQYWLSCSDKNPLSRREYEEHCKTCPRCRAFWEPYEKEFAARLTKHLKDTITAGDFFRQFMNDDPSDVK